MKTTTYPVDLRYRHEELLTLFDAAEQADVTGDRDVGASGRLDLLPAQLVDAVDAAQGLVDGGDVRGRRLEQEGPVDVEEQEQGPGIVPANAAHARARAR